MLIGITGEARHGKDTVGMLMLGHKSMMHHTRYALADKIKFFLRMSFFAPLTMEQCKEGTQDFVTTRESLHVATQSVLREALELYGVTVDEAVESLVGVLEDNFDVTTTDTGHIKFHGSWRRLLQKVGTEFGRGIDDNFWLFWMPEEDRVITDVRRDNEAEAIINRGGVIVKVIDPRKGSVVTSHVSESGINPDLVTHIIVNDGTIEDLAKQVKSVMKQISKGE